LSSATARFRATIIDKIKNFRAEKFDSRRRDSRARKITRRDERVLRRRRKLPGKNPPGKSRKRNLNGKFPPRKNGRKKIEPGKTPRLEIFGLGFRP